MKHLDSKSTELSKLTIQIPKDLHACIKAKAALQHKSVKNFIIEAVTNVLGNDAKKKNNKRNNAIDNTDKKIDIMTILRKNSKQ